MVFPDLSSILYPDTVQGRQPQGAVGIAPEWATSCLAAYPVLGLGRESANGGGRFIGIADPGLYKATIGKAGLAFSGNGVGTYASKGLYTELNVLPYRGLSAMSEFVVFELSTTTIQYECTIVRATRMPDSNGIAISVFPYQKWIRVLFQTTGTTGWSASYDVADSRMAAGVLWGVGVSYISGRRVVYSGPIGGEMLATVTTAITGAITDSSAYSGNGALYVGGLDYAGTTYAFPGKIYTAAFWRDVKTLAEFKELFVNPWQIYTAPRFPFTNSAQVSLPTLGRAIADTSTGLWVPSTGTSLFGCINEEIPADENYITVTGASTCELVLNETAFPLGDIQTISYRASSQYSSNLTVTLKQGSTTIASWTHVLTGIDTLYSQTLTAPQVALITAGALSVQLTAS